MIAPEVVGHIDPAGCRAGRQTESPEIGRPIAPAADLRLVSSMTTANRGRFSIPARSGPFHCRLPGLARVRFMETGEYFSVTNQNELVHAKVSLETQMLAQLTAPGARPVSL
jgi:hypothetical protein